MSFHSGMDINRFYNELMATPAEPQQSAAAAARASATVRAEATLRETTLNNGLKVLIQEEHTAPLASVWCWYKVGSRMSVLV